MISLENIRSIGPKTLLSLNKLGIYTTDDLIRYYPYRYNIYKPTVITNNTNSNEIININAKIISEPRISYIRRNFNRIEFMVEHNHLTIKVVIFNRAFLKKTLIINKEVLLIGKYDQLKNQFLASDIKLKRLEHTLIEPVYHLNQDITSQTLSKCIKNALDSDISVENAIPEYIQEQYDFIDTIKAIKEIHDPTGSELTKKATLKLKYDELFNFMFKINILKFKNTINDSYVIKNIKNEEVVKIINDLPFTLTSDQKTAINDIVNDFNAPRRMNRLLLGDVGSGKTIVAFIALLINHQCGYQGALLAPTEVLALQHYNNFISLYPNIKCKLLVGNLNKHEKDIIKQQLLNNEIDVIIGTHALLTDDIVFNNLGLVVTDEQHRFGVNQRKNLVNKGNCVDVLYTTATPIPRTYALTIYGDMDISMIKEKPSGRKPIETSIYKLKDTSYFKLIENELASNHQIYVVVPLIDDSESLLNDINNILTLFKDNLTNNYKIGVLHGKMKPNEKDKAINDFKEGKTDILVSTTVIEVGIDVKNATMMIIYNAERFGLATLHQLRGRVGRNELDSKCILVSDSDTERLKVMCESNDGFYISEMDLKLRGSGDLFGIRQSGDMVFKIANLETDYRILLQCKKDADEFVKNNIETGFSEYPYYQTIENQLIKID